MNKIIYLLIFILISGCGVTTNGRNGKDGVQGEKGEQGMQGVDATPVSVVQLCPGYPRATYPNNFPEVALCIGNSLYGIYNTQNHGLDYLSELPPGDYGSIAPDSCNLTIGSNCSVTQH